MSRLPVEICREIVILSAYSSPRQAATLAQVSHFFRDWTQPILYRICKYYSYDDYWPGPFPPTVTWFEANGKHIRDLMWALDVRHKNPYSADQVELIPLLEQCPNLQGLVLWVNLDDNDLPSLQLVLSTLPLRRLSINPFALLSTRRFINIHALNPIFRFVTHFQMFSHVVTGWEEVSGLAELPNLTHLAFSNRGNSAIISEVASRCQKLKVIILFKVLSSLPESLQDFSVPRSLDVICDDPRVVGLDCELMGDWEVGVRGGRDTWTKAEEIIEGRLKIRLGDQAKSIA